MIDRTGIKNIIGRDVDRISIAYGSRLYIDFESKKIVNLYSDDIHNTFGIRFISRAGWRIISNNKYICGVDDYDYVIENALNSLTLGKVTDVIQPNDFDLTIVLEPNIRVDFFCTSSDDVVLLIDNPVAGFSIELDSTGWNLDDKRDIVNKNQRIDEFLNEYKVNLIKRWDIDILPGEGHNICDNCFYFRGIDGNFKSTDFGICSNEIANNDGKLVKSTAGCKECKSLAELI